ncbi:hypothetical protein Taro_036215 [Colocasia esculenta]|uniref:Uncharacterized protein n=1 Tax=Colocasia esculenta TaxID=4460 RepID=A0A843W2H0_COLES|nr:hypothetical protein [Colocasia esculenta]
MLAVLGWVPFGASFTKLTPSLSQVRVCSTGRTSLRWSVSSEASRLVAISLFGVVLTLGVFSNPSESTNSWVADQGPSTWRVPGIRFLGHYSWQRQLDDTPYPPRDPEPSEMSYSESSQDEAQHPRDAGRRHHRGDPMTQFLDMMWTSFTRHMRHGGGHRGRAGRDPDLEDAAAVLERFLRFRPPQFAGAVDPDRVES